MSQDVNPIPFYKEQLVNLDKKLEALVKRKNQIAWMRFGAIAAAFTACYLLWPVSLVAAAAGFLLFFALFLRLVVLDIKNKSAIDNTNTLININNEEIKIASHLFTHRPDGAEFQPPVHDYANDLDIFGRASIYQYMNRTTSELGHRLLADWLLFPAENKTILDRQEAAKELLAKTEWRQQLQAYGTNEKLEAATQLKINDWISEPNQFLGKKSWNSLRFLFPAIILALLAIYIAGIIPGPIFAGAAFIFFLISGYISKRIMPMYDKLNKIAPQIDTLSASATCIESVSFKSSSLRKVQEQFFTGNKKASAEIRHLKHILDRFDIRLNPLVFIPLNTLLFWDLQQAFALERWKDEHRNKVPHWFSGLGEMEAISSLSTLSFNHPGWCFPVLSDIPGTCITNGIGHPLIESAKRVSNSFATVGLPRLALITGSNMAGKSTFLRSMGVAVVLAMMGAPVCAANFTLYPVKIMSSMRIADNLEESTSTFYAELKKLKSIIEAVNRKEKIFILLDEILRGTNSLDRHTGSKALIKQLIHHDAVGMIATHDLELAGLTAQFPDSIQNYHFDVQVENDELFFDYKLKTGICESLNASILMKKIGIEL